jgi:UDP-N-acetylmuramate dehydrogenase
MLIQENIPLKDKNWFQTGGPARFYAAPRTADEFQQALAYAQQHNLATFILGAGANILISDAGFNGLIIHPKMVDITQRKENGTAYVTAGAGVQMSDLITYCLNNTITGLEEFSGIPGTIGGSVYINLHYFEFLLEHFLLEAQVMHKQTCVVETVPTSWFEFGYNKSRLQQHEYYLLSATFKLKASTPLEAAYAHGRAVEIARHRAKRYPATHTCGSFFRNFHEHEVTLMSNNKKMIYVAYYLDKIGVKGTLRSGDALVSHQHANMLVNCGQATSTDIITLARTLQEMVQENFGIIPRPECLLLGFDKDALMP